MSDIFSGPGRQIGQFHVYGGPDLPSSMGTLRAAQEGCTIVECFYRSWKQAWYVVAFHPEFKPDPFVGNIPEYSAEIVVVTDPKTGERTYKRERFMLLSPYAKVVDQA